VAYNTQMFTSINILDNSTSESYKFYEPVPLGPYTVQFWSVSLLKCTSPSLSNHSPNTHKLQGYLPQGTHGLRLPRFTFSMPHSHHCPSNNNNDGVGVGLPTSSSSSSRRSITPRFPNLGPSRDEVTSWQIAIYKNGDIIVEPQFNEDFKDFGWAYQSGPWMNQSFTKEQIWKIVRDIGRKFEPNVSEMVNEKMMFSDCGNNALLLGVV